MKFLSITGPKKDIDRVVDVYLKKYEIHLENALSELSAVHDLTPFIEVNPYKELLNKSEDLIKRLNPDSSALKKDMSTEEAKEVLNNALTLLNDLSGERNELKTKKQYLNDLINQIEPFRSIDFELKRILSFKFIKFRFGKIPYEYFDKFSKYAYDNLNTVFLDCYSNDNYVWGVYFVPESSSGKIDAIFSSLHFERIMIPNEYEGTPQEAYEALNIQINEINIQRKILAKKINQKLQEEASKILQAYEFLRNLSENFDVRKLAACTKEKQQVFYILCGWITAKDTKRLLKDIADDPDVYCFIEGDDINQATKPPTKLKNPKLFRPFEMFIRMYGMPAYHEIDPTIFVALTYSFMFGMMFGDVGQGLCLVVVGFVLYKIKKLNLAAIMSLSGVFSTIFGFLYGSIFGFEEILHPIWVNPMKDTMTVLYTAIGFGVVLIIIAMIMNIINSIRAKDVEKTFFDTNGIAGLVFYVVVVAVALLAITGHGGPSMIVLFIGIILPLILIFLREPLTRLIKKKSKLIPGSKGMFFLESFFELFEVLLSYITNTISFVRVGSFALSHAGMMTVVLMLGKAAEAEPNYIIIILGNIFVACLEGLIVGIQVLRLEYYEMFSRFYKGTGKEFKPYKSKI